MIDADFLKEWIDEYLSVFKKYDKGTIKGFVDHAPTIEPSRGMRQTDVLMGRETMSKWIDADALTQEIKQDIADNGLTERYVFYRINEAPSIDIVRCKECKHYAEHNELYINEPTTCVKHSVIGHYVVVNPEDFCSYGERREP